MKTTVQCVEEFHVAFGLPVRHTPTIPPASELLLRVQLIQEELGEYTHAVAKGDMEKALDALTDLQYVLDGTYVVMGVQHIKQAAFDEVQRANMSKLGPDGKPIVDAAGRVVKPDGWQPPNIAGVLSPEMRRGD